MKETFYFSHDYYARSDLKLTCIKKKHGMAGLGIYWCLIEMLYEQGGYLPLEYESISFELQSDTNVIQSVVCDCGLFEFDKKKFWSKSVLCRLELRNEKSEKARESIRKRWEKYERNTNVSKNDTNVIRATRPRNTIKESKVKEIYTPTLDEVKIFFKEKGFKEEIAVRAWSGYDTAGWIDTEGKPVLNWKQKMINVWFTEENRSTTHKLTTTLLPDDAR